MLLARARRLLFERLILNLAMLLGLTQLLVGQWMAIVVLGRDGLGLPFALVLGALLVFANALAVPCLRRSRRRGDWGGVLARAYMDSAVATLLLGLTIATAWFALLLLSGLLGAVGADPKSAFGSFRAVSIGAVGGVALMIAWGYTVGQATVERTRLRVDIPGLSPELAGLRLVQISDLHIGNRLDGERLERMMAHANALEPDLIAITGDLFDFDPAYVEDGARLLAKLRARYGVYAILGNHDVYTGAQTVASALARHAPQIRLLRNEIVQLPLPAPLYLAGLEDDGCNWAGRALELPALDALAAARPKDGPVLLLVHRPEAFSQAARHGFPLVLAGHTHGGQLALPTLGGRYNLARFMTPLTRGVFHSNGTTLYVNRGLGVGGPALRFNCRREIATIELVPRALGAPFPARRPADGGGSPPSRRRARRCGSPVRA